MLIPTTDKSLTQVSTVFDDGAAFEGIVVALARISHQYVDTWAKGIDEGLRKKTA